MKGDINKIIEYYIARKHTLQKLCDNAKDRKDKTNVRVYRGQINLIEDFLIILNNLK